MNSAFPNVPYDDSHRHDDEEDEDKAPCIPSQETLARLEYFASIGDVSGLRQALQELVSQDVLFMPFVATLRKLVDSMQITAVWQRLEYYRKKHAS